MDELARARYEAEMAAEHELYRDGGAALLTRWMARVLHDAPHPGLQRIEAVDTATIVARLWAGPVARVAVDAVEPCSWCHGTGRGGGAVELVRPPCAACLGTGLPPDQRGGAAAATTVPVRVRGVG